MSFVSLKSVPCSIAVLPVRNELKMEYPIIAKSIGISLDLLRARLNGLTWFE